MPSWWATVGEVGPRFWSIFSGVHLGFLVLVWGILVYSLRALGISAVIAINVPVTVFVYILTAAITLTLIANTIMTSIANFSLYYSSVLGGLIIIFLVFADIAIRTD